MRAWTILIPMLLLLIPTPIWAQEEAVDPETAGAALTDAEVSKTTLRLVTQFMSPYCPGANLRDCGSGKAEVLRERIRGWVAEGRSEAWITDQLLAEFGEQILSAPRFRGMGIIAYIAPVIAVLIGLGGIMWFLQSQKGARAQRPLDEIATPGDFKLDPELEERVERELQART